MRNSLEISTITPLFTLHRMNIDNFGRMILIHSVQPSIYITDHTLSQIVESVLPIQCDNTEGALILRMQIKHVLHAEITTPVRIVD